MVMEERRETPRVDEKHLLAIAAEAFLDEVEHSCEGLSGVDGVEQDGFRLGQKDHRLRHRLCGQGISFAYIVIKTLNYVFGKRLLDAQIPGRFCS